MGNDLKALGSNTSYSDKYDSNLLEGFSRDTRRKDLVAPMNGEDIWTCFEVSFLDLLGLPKQMVIRISTNAKSENIFESKSLKLYLNSFNNSKFLNAEQVLTTIENDLSKVAGGIVWAQQVEKFTAKKFYQNSRLLEEFCPNLEISEYSYNPGLLKTKPAKERREEFIELHSNLGRSNCEITQQPDWFTFYIKYEPRNVEVTYESLLSYIVSLRTHNLFHEPTIELIYNDLYKVLKPKKLLVLGQFTRRGGIDINPCRYTHGGMLPIDLMCLPKLIQQ